MHLSEPLVKATDNWRKQGMIAQLTLTNTREFELMIFSINMAYSKLSILNKINPKYSLRLDSWNIGYLMEELIIGKDP